MCNCIDRVNQELKSSNKRLNTWGGRVSIETYNPHLDGKKHRAKNKKVIATYCPFCGEKYEVSP